MINTLYCFCWYVCKWGCNHWRPFASHSVHSLPLMFMLITVMYFHWMETERQEVLYRKCQVCHWEITVIRTSLWCGYHSLKSMSCCKDDKILDFMMTISQIVWWQYLRLYDDNISDSMMTIYPIIYKYKRTIDTMSQLHGMNGMMTICLILTQSQTMDWMEQ